MLDLLQLSVQTVIGLGIAVTTAVVTTHLALRRFRAERWWERKVDTYARILDSFFDARQMWRLMLGELKEGSQSSTENRKSLHLRANATFHEIEKHTVVGSFLISDETDRLLQALRRAMDDEATRNQDLEVRPEQWAGVYDEYMPPASDTSRNFGRCASRPTCPPSTIVVVVSGP